MCAQRATRSSPVLSFAKGGTAKQGYRKGHRALCHCGNQRTYYTWHVIMSQRDNHIQFDHIIHKQLATSKNHCKSDKQLASTCWLPSPAYWLLPVGFHIYPACLLSLSPAGWLSPAGIHLPPADLRLLASCSPWLACLLSLA